MNNNEEIEFSENIERFKLPKELKEKLIFAGIFDKKIKESIFEKIKDRLAFNFNVKRQNELNIEYHSLGSKLTGDVVATKEHRDRYFHAIRCREIIAKSVAHAIARNLHKIEEEAFKEYCDEELRKSNIDRKFKEMRLKEKILILEGMYE